MIKSLTVKRELTISIIIRAYNEERHLDDCLQAIARQTRRPDEVIVVDNNSTDNTAVIAQSFDFVTLIRERKQGMIPARNKGFAIAKGDILVQVDADVVLDEDWVARLHTNFADPAVKAVCGVLRTRMIDWGTSYSLLWPWLYMLWSLGYFGLRPLWGADLAIRREIWDEIKPALNPNDSAVHEDQDISLLLAAAHHCYVIDYQMSGTTDGVGYNYWEKLSEYVQRRRTTKLCHLERGSFDTIDRWPFAFRAMLYAFGSPILAVWYGASIARYLFQSGRRRLALFLPGSY